tara:strand:- start:5382 stop:6827 length:1446 start_codon:yes stop_codon:yes gene_type:complete
MAIGSISLPQRPVADSSKIPAITNWTPVVPYTVKQTDITDLFYFKFILEIRIDDASGELLGKIKQRPNGYTTGTTNVYSVYDVSDIINTQIENTYADQNDTTKSIHTLGSNVAAKIFSLNQNQLRKIYVKAYQEYSAGATISPTENTSENATSTKYYIAASLPLETARTSGTYFQGTAFQSFQAKDVNGRFLSDVQQSTGDVVSSSVYRNYVQWDDSTNTGDFHTLAFLNSESIFNSDIKIIVIIYYDSSGSSIGSSQVITNESGTGGAIPSTSGGEADTQPERLLYFGCGPGNLQVQSATTGARPSNFSNWAYYTIQGISGFSVKTALYYFIKQDASCKGFKIRRLGWLNSVGCWDYFNFKMKSKQSVDVKRDTYGQVLGEYNSTEYSYNNFDSTRKVRKTDAILKETLNTDWITEQDAELLEKCVMSTDVFIIENADTTYTVPVLVTNKNIVRKTSANDGIKIKYTINIEYSNPLNTNS